MGPPEELVLNIGQQFDIATFIETGTFHGGTAVWASSHFSRVFTIEKSSVLYQMTSEKLSPYTNIKTIFGDSRESLKEIIADLQYPAIFWLDSHWCGQDSYGIHDECPLLDEIICINQSSSDNFIFIDDARLFLCPPPIPHDPAQWPTISETLKILETEHNRYTVIFEDVIISVPDYAKQFLITRLRSEQHQKMKYNPFNNLFHFIKKRIHQAKKFNKGYIISSPSFLKS